MIPVPPIGIERGVHLPASFRDTFARAWERIPELCRLPILENHSPKPIRALVVVSLKDGDRRVFGQYFYAWNVIALAWDECVKLPPPLQEVLIGHEFAHAYLWSADRDHWDDEDLTNAIAVAWGFEIEKLKRWAG